LQLLLVLRHDLFPLLLHLASLHALLPAAVLQELHCIGLQLPLV
jgi:hypothetical protein